MDEIQIRKSLIEKNRERILENLDDLEDYSRQLSKLIISLKNLVNSRDGIYNHNLIKNHINGIAGIPRNMKGPLGICSVSFKNIKKSKDQIEKLSR